MAYEQVYNLHLSQSELRKAFKAKQGNKERVKCYGNHGY